MVNFLQAGHVVEPNDRGAYYRSESKYIASLVGNEVPAEKHDFFKALRYTNKASQLGLNDFEIEVIGRLLSALGKGTRFAGNPMMNKYHGENAATHSLQAVVLMEKLFHQTFKNLPDNIKKSEINRFASMRQFAGISLLLHDMGEICGEAAYATRGGVQFVGDFNKEEMERMLFERALNLAITSVEQGKSREDFAHQMAAMTDVLKINERAANKENLSRQELEGLLAMKEYAATALQPQGDQCYQQMLALWDMAERPEKQQAASEGVALPKNPALVGMMVKNIEHQQGTAHFHRFATKKSVAKSEEVEKDSMAMEEISDTQLVKNFNYQEGELEKLYTLGIKAVEDREGYFISNLVRTLRDNTYGISMKFIDDVLSAHKRIDMAAQPDEKAKVAEKYLGQLEAILTGYETAVKSDRRPQEKSLGTVLFEAVKDKDSREEMIEAVKAITNEDVQPLAKVTAAKMHGRATASEGRAIAA